MGNALKVESSTWEKEVLQADKLVMVDFWASWCGPCQVVAPVVEELATEYSGKVKIMKLNTDENPEIAGQIQDNGHTYPDVFKGGKIADQIVGAASKSQLKTKIDSLL